MVRSGLQNDVINLYRDGIRNVYSKPLSVRPNFLLHLRYSFRHLALTPRDYTAIEHQLRRFGKTLEMLQDTSVQRISVSPEMEEWWRDQVRERRGKGGMEGSGTSKGEGLEEGKREEETVEEPQGKEKGNAQSGEEAEGKSQWGGTLPGPGGT
ncbi:succinate dehydrogenase assembly factor 1, partial [Tremellales sp. Uapishka_1]